MSIGIRWLIALTCCFVLECAIGVLVVAAHYVPRPQTAASSSSRCLAVGQSSSAANIAGKVVQCDKHLCDGGGAEVLAYGLEDPRGLAYDKARNLVLIADGERSDVVLYDIARRAYVRNGSVPCPEGPCQAVDLRGIAMWHGNSYVAEHDRARIALLGAGPAADFPEDDALFAGPSGVAIDKRNSIVFVTDDRPWPGAAAAPTPYDVSDYTRWLDQNRPRMVGAAYALPVAGGKVDSTSVDVFGKDLRHPSGIAISTGGTLYVTEADQHETRWVKFKRGPDCHWTRSGVLAAAKSLDGSIPAFQGIAINGDGTNIYAAGPGGLYVFQSDGTALGRVEFDGPVTGLAWGSCGDGSRDSCLYLAVAHSLCRLHTNDTSPNPDQEGATALPSCQAAASRPPS